MAQVTSSKDMTVIVLDNDEASALADLLYMNGESVLDELTNKGTNKNPIMYYEGRLFNGIGYDVYNNKSQLKFEEKFKDGKRDGLYKEWYENGQLRVEINHKDNKREGLWKMYYENGQLKRVENFKDGTQIGAFRNWHENGQLNYECNCYESLIPLSMSQVKFLLRLPRKSHYPQSLNDAAYH